MHENTNKIYYLAKNERERRKFSISIVTGAYCTFIVLTNAIDVERSDLVYGLLYFTVLFVLCLYVAWVYCSWK